MSDIKKRGTFIHGIGASEHLDSSGERIVVEGIDITSLIGDGCFNYEHKSEEASQIVGKILEAKKILKRSDCENESHEYFWDKVKMPYLYIAGELFDAVDHSGAKDIAAMVRYDAQGHENSEAKNLINFSIEGSRLEKRGSKILKCIARKITITLTPCNKVAVAEVMDREENSSESNAKDNFTFISDILMGKSEQMSSVQINKNMANYEPKRTFTPESAPDKMKAGDRVDHTQPKEPSKPGAYGKVIIKSKEKKKTIEKAWRNGEYKPKYEEYLTGDKAKAASAAVERGVMKLQRQREEKERKDKKGPDTNSITQKLTVSEKKPKNKLSKYDSNVRKALTASCGLGAPSTLSGGASLQKENIVKAKEDDGKTPDRKRANREFRNDRKYVKGKLKGTPYTDDKLQAKVDNKLAASEKEPANKLSKSPKTDLKEVMKTISEDSFQRFVKKEELLDFLSKRLPNLDTRQINALAKTVAYVREKKQELKLKKLIDNE